MKKVISFIIALAMMISIISTVSAATYTGRFQYTAAFDSRVRTQQNTTSEYIGYLYKGSRALGEIDTGDYVFSASRWTPLTISAGLGFVRNDLICPSENLYRVNTTSGLNFRATPSTGSAPLYTLPYGAYVEKLGVSGAFYLVRVRNTGVYDLNTEGDVGYVAYQYLSIV